MIESVSLAVGLRDSDEVAVALGVLVSVLVNVSVDVYVLERVYVLV